MVEFLLDLPEGESGLLPWPEGARGLLRSQLSAVTGPVRDEELADTSIPRSLTPLQLAVFLGHRMVVTRILRRQMTTLWQWGPQSENHLFLDEIDSAAIGAHQVMDLVCRLDATQSTKSMLLDDFMGGFLFSLYEQKWQTIGYKYHYTISFLQLINLAYLVWAAGKRMQHTEQSHTLEVVSSFGKSLCSLAFLSCFLQMFEEMRGAYGMLSEFTHQGTIWSAVKLMGQEMRARDFPLKCVCVTTSVIIQLVQIVETHTGQQASIALKTVLPSLLSTALLTQAQGVIATTFLVFEKTGVYVHVIMLMLGTDVALTLSVIIPYLIAFSCAMWSVFPIEEYYVNSQDPFEILMFTWSLLMMTFNGGTSVRLAGEHGSQLARKCL